MSNHLSDITAWLSIGPDESHRNRYPTEPWRATVGSECAEQGRSLCAVFRDDWLILISEPLHPPEAGVEALESSRLPGLWKYVVPAGGSLEMRAELPCSAIDTRDDAFTTCLGATLEWPLSGTIAPPETEDVPLDLVEAFSSIGVAGRATGAASAAFDLGSRSGYYQVRAAVENWEVRLTLVFASLASTSPSTLEALNKLALRASAVLRMGRFVLGEPSPELRLECCFPSVSAGFNLEPAVQSLRAGADLFAAEALALLDEPIADAYLHYLQSHSANGRNPLYSNV